MLQDTTATIDDFIPKFRMNPYSYVGTLTKDEIKNGGKVKMSPTDIIHQVCKYFNLQYKDLICKGKRSNRKRNIYACRSLCIYFLCKKTALPLKEIGGYFGKSEHTTPRSNRIDVEEKIKIKDLIIYPAYLYLCEIL